MEVFFYDAKELRQIASFTLEHTSAITSLAFNRVNNYLISGSKDNAAKIWDGFLKGSSLTLLGHQRL
jgi:hypothetical protein